MATGTTSFSGNAFKFDISYEYTNTSFKLTSVKTTALISGWGTWELQPSLFLYALIGSEPVPKSYQSYDANGTTCKQFVTDHSGVWQLAYNGNNPGAYLPNTAGSSATWDSSDFDDITLSLSGSSATITIGAFIANTTGTLSSAAYGYSTLTFTLYTESSAYELIVTDVKTAALSVKHSWTNGSIAGSDYAERSITVKTDDGSFSQTKSDVADGTTMVFTGLQPNKEYTIIGVADDGTTKLTSTIKKYTNTQQPTDVSSTKTENSLILKGISNNYTSNLNYKYILTKPDNTTETKSAPYDQEVTFSSLRSNVEYVLQIFAYNSATINTSPAKIMNIWTKPKITDDGLSLTVAPGSENSKINVVAVPENISLYDTYSFKLNSEEYSEFNKANNTSYSGLAENTTYIVSVILKNTKSGLQSEPITKNITTWYNPLTDLSVVLNRNWFWFLEVKSSYTYNGTISKFEFSIGKEPYKDTGTNNLYSRGSTIEGNPENLDYYSDYLCKVKVIDNHGRIYEASDTFRTMDERPLYINGVLREVRLIKQDGSMSYITPNLLTVVTPNDTTINMNKIINNDDRTSFS